MSNGCPSQHRRDVSCLSCCWRSCSTPPTWLGPSRASAPLCLVGPILPTCSSCSQMSHLCFEVTQFWGSRVQAIGQNFVPSHPGASADGPVTASRVTLGFPHYNHCDALGFQTQHRELIWWVVAVMRAAGRRAFSRCMVPLSPCNG